MRILLVLVCMFSSLAALWLVAMENMLRRPGYGMRTGFDLLLVLAALVTLLALARPGRLVNAAALVGGAAIAVYGVRGLVRNATRAHFEGYVALLAAALVAQGLLTALVLCGVGSGRRARRVA